MPTEFEYGRSFCIHTNGIESVWALLKRQIASIHHFVSPKHLSRYLDEMAWRFSRRGHERWLPVERAVGRGRAALTYLQGLIA